MSAYAKDLRLKVLVAVDRGVPRREVIGTFGVSLAVLKRWVKRRSKGGDLSPRPSPGGTPSILATKEERRALWAQLEANDDATLERHCEMWEREKGVRVSVAAISQAVRKLGWTFKKVAGGLRARRGEAEGLTRAPEGRRGVRGRVLEQRRPHRPLREGA